MCQEKHSIDFNDATEQNLYPGLMDLFKFIYEKNPN